MFCKSELNSRSNDEGAIYNYTVDVFFFRVFLLIDMGQLIELPPLTTLIEICYLLITNDVFVVVLLCVPHFGANCKLWWLTREYEIHLQFVISFLSMTKKYVTI